MESKRLLNSIKKISGIELNGNKSRKRPVVEAKQLYCKLMRDAGHTYESIGEAIGMHHATVLHHYNNYEYIKKFSSDLKSLEESVIDNLSLNNEESILLRIEELSGEINRLEELLSHSTKKVDVKPCVLEK